MTENLNKFTRQTIRNAKSALTLARRIEKYLNSAANTERLWR